jgi:F-type H+-transporting ATPase subunit delta
MRLITRYAEAFLEYARDSIGIDRALDELKAVKEALRDNDDFKGFLENPAINYAEKCTVLDSVFASGFSDQIKDFLKLLLKKGRIEEFDKIAEYARIRYAHGDRISALLYTSYLMETSTMESFREIAEKKLNAKLQLYVDLEPEMLGGARLVVGNKVWDGSVKKRLEDMKRKLLAARVA